MDWTSPLYPPDMMFQEIALGITGTMPFLAPFFLLVGIPLAFIVGGYLISFIRAMISTDKSSKFLGFYVQELPYKGYNRWRSEDWNRKNTM